MKKMASREDDRISGLPDNVRVHILKFLSAPDAVKASVLSTKWRNMWVNLPSLHLDHTFCRMDHERGFNCSKNKVNEVMLNFCRILLLHRGPLVEFTLSYYMFTYFPDQIDQILWYLENKSIESLTMGDDYKLPRRLLTSQSFSQLKTLRLSRCQFTSTPVSFEGFRMLTVLELKWVKFNDSSASPWSIRCPLLESLTLNSCCDFLQGSNSSYSLKFKDRFSYNIVIEAPKLSCFYFFGGFESLHLKVTPLLKKATIHKLCPFSKCVEYESNLLKVWDGLAAVESLTVADHFYQYLAVGDVEINQRPWEMLRELTLNKVRLCRRSNVWSFVLMITNSPNLQLLTVNMKRPYSEERRDEPMSKFYGGHVDVCEFLGRVEYPDGEPKYVLGRLERVKVTKMGCSENDNALIKWLLNSSPSLVEMDIKFPKESCDAAEVRFLKQLIGYKKRSIEARIVVN